ncbi:MAG TPA: hypothetical protein ENJ42_02250 [Hellea balneolensis]|uniref:Uncharacterized protein n=1 Tax=Hellea balneolensis TaxID=287478 RepID=A0A7C5LYN4_9PROT|nr:hypothetical protein [Hellea balneolensis]
MSAGFLIMGKAYIAFMAIVLNAGWVANQNPGDAEAMLNAYSGIGQHIPMLLLGTLLVWAAYAAAETAFHKKVFHNIDYGLIPLRFGRAELRTMLVQFVVYLFIFGIILGFFIVFGVLVALMAVLGGMSKILAILVGLILVVLYFAMFFYLVYASVRLAPASALTVATNELHFKGGWAITKGRTGSLFLAYLFIYIVGYIVITLVQMTAMSSLLGENSTLVMMGLSEQSPADMFASVAEKLKEPTTMITLVIGGIIYMIALATWYLAIAGVGSYAVQWWRADDEVSQFE